MSSHRCSSCGVSWWGTLVIREHGRIKCPECLGSIDQIETDPTGPYDEQKSRRNHAMFRRFCEERDAKTLAEIERLASIPVADN